MKLTDVEVFQTPKHPSRDDFEFPITITAILSALNSRITYHEARLSFWLAELATASKQLKENTKVIEQQVTGGVQHIAQVDQVASQRVNQCEGKLSLHRQRLWQYKAWWYCYSLLPQGTSNRYLSVGDVMAFGLVVNPAEED